MPMYDYKCDMCGNVEEMLVPLDKVDRPQECKYCQQRVMQRQFPVEAIKQLQVWEPHYSEMFDCDIPTKREYDRILRDKGAIEAGDRVRGARDFDPKANNMEPQPLKGKQYVTQDMARLERTAGRARDRENLPVGVEAGSVFKEV